MQEDVTYGMVEKAVNYYADLYGLKKDDLWSILDNLFGIHRNDKVRIDPADQLEFAAVVANYAENRKESA